jgi:hypothetical protein
VQKDILHWNPIWDVWDTGFLRPLSVDIVSKGHGSIFLRMKRPIPVFGLVPGIFKAGNIDIESAGMKCFSKKEQVKGSLLL